jgi:hypothetical protein
MTLRSKRRVAREVYPIRVDREVAMKISVAAFGEPFERRCKEVGSKHNAAFVNDDRNAETKFLDRRSDLVDRAFGILRLFLA